MEGHRISFEDLQQRFQFHPHDAVNKSEAHAKISEILLRAADEIVELTGAPSRAQSTAVTKLEESALWAHAAVDQGDGPRA